MTNPNKIFLAFYLTICLLFISLFTSCEIGLGSSIDTEAPSFRFAWPNTEKAESPIIRDRFKIKGSFEDDGQIDSIRIILSKKGNANYKREYFYKPGNSASTINVEGKSWSCIIDPIKDNIQDGSYQCVTIFKDSYGHKTENTCSFSIDNTPPILALQRPSSAKNASSEVIDSYGQGLTLEGQGADDSYIALLKMNFYADAECKDFLHSVELKNVPNSIKLNVAKFILDDKESDYAKIYGAAQKAGAKQIYCSMQAYDGSMRYPIDGPQSEEDKKGNMVDSYYLYESIATSVFSEHTITELYAMKNGTYSNQEEKNKIFEILKQNKVDIGTFMLDPDISPRYSVIGRKSLPLNADLNTDSDAYLRYFASEEITVGNLVVIDVSAGLDQTPLVNTEENPIKVYIQEFNSATGDVLEGSQKIELPTEQKKQGLSYKFSAMLDATLGLEIGADYIVTVEGKDEKGNEIVPENQPGYGFKLISTGEVPTITMINPNPNDRLNAKKDDVIKIEGIVTVSDPAGVQQPKVEIKVGKKSTYSDFKITPVGDNLNFKFTADVPVEYLIPSGKENTTINSTYIISATLGGNPGTITNTICYDVEKPIVKLTNIDPVVSRYTQNKDGTKEITVADQNKQFLNGTVNIQGSFYDLASGIDEDFSKGDACWYITDLSGNKLYKKDGAEIGGIIEEDFFKISIDTTQITNDKEHTVSNSDFGYKDVYSYTEYDVKDVYLVISVKDKAGNITNHKEQFTIDQSTTIPMVCPSDPDSISFEFGTVGDINDEKNTFVLGSKLFFTYYDDKGVKSVKFHCYKAGADGNADQHKYRDIDCGGKKEGSVTFELTTEEYQTLSSSNFDLEITVEDIDGNIRRTQDQYGKATEYSYKFSLRATNGIPQFAPIVMPNWIGANERPEVILNFTLSEGSELYRRLKSDADKIDWKATKGYGTPLCLVASIPKGQTQFIDTFEGNCDFYILDMETNTKLYNLPKEGTNVYQYILISESGKHSVIQEVTIRRDSVKPRLVYGNPTKEGKTVVFNGTAIDENDGSNNASGIKEIFVIIQELELQGDIVVSRDKIFSNTIKINDGKWSFDFPLKSFENDKAYEYNILGTGSDVAGNPSDPLSVSFKINFLD